MASLWAYHRFRFIRDFGKQNTRGNVSKMRAIDRSDRNPPITATRCDLLTFATSCYGALIGGFQSDLSQTRLKEILEVTFPRVVAHQRKPELKTYSAGFISVEYVGKKFTRGHRRSRSYKNHIKSRSSCWRCFDPAAWIS